MDGCDRKRKEQEPAPAVTVSVSVSERWADHMVSGKVEEVWLSSFMRFMHSWTLFRLSVKSCLPICTLFPILPPLLPLWPSANLNSEKKGGWGSKSWEKTAGKRGIMCGERFSFTRNNLKWAHAYILACTHIVNPTLETYIPGHQGHIQGTQSEFRGVHLRNAAWGTACEAIWSG